ncbi:hypothetical protein KIW84_073645 [Lathyrus oleraceus]|uniref:Uncharacterized protein n=1 Tax=Pisum sativum TaxID=3888 RepID=A0A9D4ZVV9_PEA|nr:hypothetical protein KIW84_073645 [Pisum sativum]
MENDSRLAAPRQFDWLNYLTELKGAVKLPFLNVITLKAAQRKRLRKHQMQQLCINSPTLSYAMKSLNKEEKAYLYIFCPVAGDGFTISNSNNELIGDLPNALSDIYSHGMTSELPDRIITEFTAIDDAEPVDGVIKNQGQVSEFAPNHGHIGDFVPAEMSREDPQGDSQVVVSQSNAGASNLAAFNQSSSLRSPPIFVGQVTIGTSSESQGGTNVESNNELHEKSGSPKDSDTTQRVIEAQLDGPNMNKTNSRVLDESPGFSNQNDVAESGCQRLDRLETNSRTVKGAKVIGQDNEAYGFVLQPLRWSKGSQNICSDQDLPASNQSLRILKSS